MFTPKVCEPFFLIRADDNHFCLSDDKLGVILAQLRHVPAAERSKKAPVEYQQDILALQGRQANFLPGKIRHFEIRGKSIERDSRHHLIILSLYMRPETSAARKHDPRLVRGNPCRRYSQCHVEGRQTSSTVHAVAVISIPEDSLPSEAGQAALCLGFPSSKGNLIRESRPGGEAFPLGPLWR